jgi:hypothetical protein
MRPPLCLGLCMQACLRDMTRTEAFVWCRCRPSKWASFVRRARKVASHRCRGAAQATGRLPRCMGLEPHGVAVRGDGGGDRP